MENGFVPTVRVNLVLLLGNPQKRKAKPKGTSMMTTTKRRPKPVGKGRRQLQKQRAAVSFLSDVYVSTDKRRYHSHQAEETIIDASFHFSLVFFWLFLITGFDVYGMGCNCMASFILGKCVVPLP
jgi:hypothetical protein